MQTHQITLDDLANHRAQEITLEKLIPGLTAEDFVKKLEKKTFVLGQWNKK